MVFWTAATLLILLATLPVVSPLLRAPGRGASAFDHDRELYRARLAEIDADLELGRIGASEAEAARTEEGRKLIALSQSADATQTAGSPGLSRLTLVSTAIFVPLAAVTFYVMAGIPGMPDMAIASRPDRDLTQQTITQLLERAEGQLARNPDDARGWRVVAPVYLRLGRVQDAVTAWRNAARLQPEDAGLKTSLGEAMTIASGGVVTEEARQVFLQALESRPGDAKARFYLAIALGQQGSDEEAAQAWRDLIADAPADAPWLEVARAQLQAVSGRLGEAGRDTEPAAPGPSQDDIAAAAGMSSEDRRSMIESMVTGLADKLKDDPDDKPGWQRLVRSWGVLGETDKARAAADQARKAFPDDAEFLARIDAIVAQMSDEGVSR
ncbi:MAG: c-type cytochrome biogenesis protein CcmI [Pseudomonadota bacterium]|nr:c-type cytochrome biogenesis protein CcmI [Pseudomonadota bacterium]